MKAKSVCLAATCVAAIVAGCNSRGPGAGYDPAVARAEIEEIEDAWARVAVSGDPAVIERIFADDFAGVAPDGARYSKQQFIEDTRAHPLGFTSNVVNEIKVRFEGNVAVAQGDETFARSDGSRGRFVWTDVLVRRDGRWHLIAAQDAVAPAEGEATQPLFTSAGVSAADREGIDRLRSEYAANWRGADAAKVAALYTQDALVLYPDQPPVVGRAAIQDYFKGFFAEFPKNEFELTSAEINVVGAWAFDRGAYRWKGAPKSGPAILDHGKYLVILARQANGEWRVARDMDNSDVPKTQATRSASAGSSVRATATIASRNVP